MQMLPPGLSPHRWPGVAGSSTGELEGVKCGLYYSVPPPSDSELEKERSLSSLDRSARQGMDGRLENRAGISTHSTLFIAVLSREDTVQITKCID